MTGENKLPPGCEFREDGPVMAQAFHAESDVATNYCDSKEDIADMAWEAVGGRAEYEQSQRALQESKSITLRLAADVIRLVCGVDGHPIEQYDLDRLCEDLRKSALSAVGESDARRHPEKGGG